MILFKWMKHDLGERSPVAAVAFKYLKKAKHRSDILNGLNIIQPAKKNEHTRKSVAVSRKGFFSRLWSRDLICIILKREIETNKLQMCAAGKVLRVYI